MKLLILLVFIVYLNSLVLSKSSGYDVDDSTLLFANFFSYSTSDCSGESNGFGYSFLFSENSNYKCFNAFQPFQQNPDNFWKIEYDKESDLITSTRYSEWDFNCSDSNSGSSSSGTSGTSGSSSGSGNQEHQFTNKNNECSIMPNFTVIATSSLSGMGNTWYTRASISIGKPMYVPGSTIVVWEYYDNNSKGNCNMANFRTAVTYSQDLTLKIQDVNESETWYCKDNHALENECDYNGKNCQTFDNTEDCNLAEQYGNQRWYCITP